MEEGYKHVFRILGASSHTDRNREENDFYATIPEAIDYLLEGGAVISHNVWECACGMGHLSKRLTELGYDVLSTDLVYRGFGVGGVDFLQQTTPFDGTILTNPPYKQALEFINHALELVPEGEKVFMFLKLQFLESRKRRKLFDTKQLKTVYVSSSRISCADGGRFDRNYASAISYAWYEFEKGYYGDPVIKWIN